MADRRKTFTTELTTGFGERSKESGGRFYRKDGRPNIVRRGIGFFERLSWYHTILSMPTWKFWLLLLVPYILVNSLFGFIYFFIGMDQFVGIHRGSPMHDYFEAFFFSVQTFTTVGYGRISPDGMLTNAIASFESFLGVLFLALASGLFFGRFSRPRSFLRFSDIALIAPYKNGIALMFRMAPYKNNHLMDAEVVLTIAMKVKRDGMEKNEFYPIKAEISKINSLVLNWTIVHAINENSPIYGMTLADLKSVNAEVLVSVKAFDEGFSNTVVARSSYTANEIVEGAKFKPMYKASESGTETILQMDLLNAYEKVDISELMPVLTE